MKEQKNEKTKTDDLVQPMSHWLYASQKEVTHNCAVLTDSAGISQH